MPDEAKELTPANISRILNVLDQFDTDYDVLISVKDLSDILGELHDRITRPTIDMAVIDGELETVREVTINVICPHKEG